MEQVVQLVQSGDAYAAVERMQVIIRKLKKENRIDDAMILYMKLAILLAQNNHWKYASVCASRSIDLFPQDATTIKTVLKELFFSFFDLSTPDAACPEYFKFCQNLSYLFSKSTNTILKKEAYIASKANYFSNSQSFLIQILTNSDDVSEWEETISNLIRLQWKWILYYQENKEQMIKISQYIICRCMLILSTISNTGLKHAKAFIQNIGESIPESLKCEKILELPLVNFSRFYLKALENKSKETADFLIAKYKCMLEKDTDLLDWCNRSQVATEIKKQKSILDGMFNFKNQ